MAWYEEAVFYHIYPLGLLGAPELNDHSQPVHRLPELKEWVDHMKACGFTALYLGPCFCSGSHGYDTEDYRRLDERLGDNEDLKDVSRIYVTAGASTPPKLIDEVISYLSSQSADQFAD